MKTNTNTDTAAATTTAADFERFEEKARSMTLAELQFASRDAFEAYMAAHEHNPDAALRYLDECQTYTSEIVRRQNKGPHGSALVVLSPKQTRAVDLHAGMKSEHAEIVAVERYDENHVAVTTKSRPGKQGFSGKRYYKVEEIVEGYR